MQAKIKTENEIRVSETGLKLLLTPAIYIARFCAKYQFLQKNEKDLSLKFYKICF